MEAEMMAKMLLASLEWLRQPDAMNELYILRLALAGEVEMMGALLKNTASSVDVENAVRFPGVTYASMFMKIVECGPKHAFLSKFIFNLISLRGYFGWTENDLVSLGFQGDTKRSSCPHPHCTRSISNATEVDA
eukprot:6492128-Amphidinium_carterae.4